MPNTSDSAEPKTSAAERARLRRNQRNSRARKQEYIQDLEHRWSECVRLGVQASAEIQKQARRIHEENQALRTIIAELGISNETLQQRLCSASSAKSPQSYTLTRVQKDKSMTSRGGPVDSAEESNFSNLQDSSLPPPLSSAGPSWTRTALPHVQERDTMLDPFPTWDLNNWLNDLSNIHAAYGIEAQARFGPDQDALFPDAIFTDYGLFDTADPNLCQADEGQQQWKLQEHVSGHGTQLVDLGASNGQFTMPYPDLPHEMASAFKGLR